MEILSYILPHNVFMEQCVGVYVSVQFFERWSDLVYSREKISRDLKTKWLLLFSCDIQHSSRENWYGGEGAVA